MPDGTNPVVLAAHAFIARLAAIIPTPRRHVTRYFGVLSSHSALRSRIIPTATLPLPADTRDEQTPADATPPGKRKSKYIPWNDGKNRLVLACVFRRLATKSQAKSGLARLLP